MRLLGLLEFAIVFIGAVGMVAASVFYLPNGVHLGLFLVGAGIALGGLESIFTRGISFRVSTLSTDHYAGTPALIWGSTILLVGATLIACAYLMEQGLWRTTVVYVMRRPGGLLSLLGLIVAGAGALIVFIPRPHGFVWTLLVGVPKTIVGIAIVIAGLAAVCLGLWEAIDPLSFTRVIKSALAQAGLPTYEHYWRRMLSALL
ncbi:MAG: hypothetical protein Q8K18_00650 [Burkholderiales bacterium]|nr:hypothetical protein [Burkholderiales bacterium]